MGTVYQAVDRNTRQVVAIKVLHGKGGTDAARFDQEAALLAELRHPGIVSYVDHGITANGESYIAMEWLAGETLDDRLGRGPLSAAVVARLGARVLEALAAAHERGIVHRDIKPSNIFLVGWRLDDIRILDFGIARRVFDSKRFTKAGSTVGTPMYTAPEQARGQVDIDGRADVFSLGCVLFECLTGEPPFTGESPMEVMAKICIGQPVRLGARRPGFPPELEALINGMLLQDRNKRPGDAGALSVSFSAVSEALETISEDREMTPTPAITMLSEVEQRVMCALIVSLPPGGGDTTLLQSAIEPLGGHIDRQLDRSMLVTWTGQGTLREQAVQVARCALALRTILPRAAMAIATGRASMLAKQSVGPLVDRVANLLGPEGSNEIRVDAITLRLLPTRFVIGEVDGRRQLLEESTALDRPRAIKGQVGPFVGRDRELQALIALYNESVDESVSRAALVLGGPGMGKTRIRHELISALTEQTGVVPQLLIGLGALVRPQTRYPLLGSVLQRAGIDIEGHATGTEVQDAWLAWLRAQLSNGPPLLLLLEDLQWADVACLKLVDAALRTFADKPFTVIALGRPEVDEQFPSLWAERSIERLRLPPLGRRAGQILLRTYLPELTPEREAFVLERWEGNPFYLEELVEVALAEPPVTPETVLGMVELRFDELVPEVRRLLRAASIFGDDSFSSESLLALVGERHRRELGEWLEALLTRDLIVRDAGSGDTSYRFRQKLVREAVYRTLPATDRALGRRLARAWLENAGRTLPECLSVPLSQSASIIAAS